MVAICHEMYIEKKKKHVQKTKLYLQKSSLFFGNYFLYKNSIHPKN